MTQFRYLVSKLVKGGVVLASVALTACVSKPAPVTELTATPGSSDVRLQRQTEDSSDPESESAPPPLPSRPDSPTERFARGVAIDSGPHIPDSLQAVDVDGDRDIDMIALFSREVPIRAAGPDPRFRRIVWYENIGGTEGFGAQQLITPDVRGASSVRAADIDGDGDADLIAASSWGDGIVWYENTNGTFSAGAEIISGIDRAISIHVADIDDDGDLDIVAASLDDDRITWYANAGGAGSFLPGKDIDTDVGGPRVVSAADVDGDDDLDLLAVVSGGRAIVWYENVDGTGIFSPANEVARSERPTWWRAPIVVDLDGDGDSDLLARSQDRNTVWFENHDGVGAFTGPREFPAAARWSRPLGAADVDGDGDPDVLLGGASSDRLVWHRNTDGAGAFSAPMTVAEGFNRPGSALSVDVDGDGDIDIVNAVEIGGRIAWYENTDGNGSFEPRVATDTGVSDETAIRAADFDGDGDLDVLSATGSIYNVRRYWYENRDGAGTFSGRLAIVIEDARPHSSVLADIDGDGDLDMVASWPSRFAWYENTDGAGSFASGRPIDEDGLVGSARPVDLDGDGDLDLLVRSLRTNPNRMSWYENRMSWYENRDRGVVFVDRGEIATVPRDRPVFVEDFDLDGDLDLLLDTTFYGNNQGVLTTGGQAPHLEFPAGSGPNAILFRDLEADNDLDVLTIGGPHDRDQLRWLRNDNGRLIAAGMIASSLYGFGTLRAGDVDGDGDTDIVTATHAHASVFWLENVRDLGASSEQHAISHSAIGPTDVELADLDGDGDLDVLSVGNNEIIWNENLSIQ